MPVDPASAVSAFLRSLAREPLVHFVLIGAALFAVYRVGGGGSIEPARRIEIGAAEVQRLAAAFSRNWMRPPTAEELRGLVENEVREEVYYREAVAMGLDRNDEIIRRRLHQKLEFLSGDLAAPASPTEAELQAHLDAHAERFRVNDGALPALTEVRESVLRDWQNERRREASERFYRSLRSKYAVSVDEAALARSAAPETAVERSR